MVCLSVSSGIRGLNKFYEFVTEKHCTTIGFQSLTEAMDVAKRTGPLALEAVLQMKVPALRYRSVIFKSREFCDHALLKTSGLTAVTVSRELAVLKEK